jgi:hypothetical protein
MNPGYLSIVLLVVSLILFASGWTDFLMRGITSKVILLFFISWLVTMEGQITLEHAHIGLWIAVPALASIAIVVRSSGIMHRLHIVSAGLLLGSVTFFLLETIHLIPSLLLGSVELTMALLSGLLISALIKLPAVQLAVVTIGLLLGEAYFRFVHKDLIGFQLGTADLQDRWWLTLYVTRLVSLLLASIALLCRKSIRFIAAEIRKRVRYRYRDD